jgi:integrase/recombinase XerD
MRSDANPITVFINEDMWAIINRWGSKDRSPNNYIFPILEPGMTHLRQYDVVQLFLGLINEWMEGIRQHLGIEKKITTYVARHTFSAVMKRSGTSTEYIQEALGHSNVKIFFFLINKKILKQLYYSWLSSFLVLSSRFLCSWSAIFFRD